MQRDAVLQQIKDSPNVSVLIIGGGINGIGTFRDLALQGVDVLLVEKEDFCSGASAASSHMVHGGVRYLENGEFRLVREALTERNLLLQNAPHYVKPLPTTIPIFSWFSGLFNAPLKFFQLRDKPSERGAVVIKLGLTLYDWFTRNQQTLPTHKFALRKESLKKRPQLNPKVVSTATYYDAWMPYPERIAMELILDAEKLSPQAHALNYVMAVGAEGDSVTLHDELAGKDFTVKPQIVINAAGPWIDFANTALGQETKFIGGTKGSHIVVDHPELYEANAGHEMFFENTDGRICLFFPLQDRMLIGTTDIAIDNPDDARCTDEEVDYMLSMVKIVFPKINVSRDDIVFKFSGVRPLPASDAATTGQISRDHSIRVLEPNDNIAFPMYSLIGGKWTTFRAFSEQTTDKILSRLGKPRRDSTQKMAIGGGKDYPQSVNARQDWLTALEAETNIEQSRLMTLFDRYGTGARDIALSIAEGDDIPLAHVPTYSSREVAYIVEHEKVVHLEDFLLRRSLLAMLGKLTAEGIEELGGVVSVTLNWTKKRLKSEIERAQVILKDKHDVDLSEKVSLST